MKLVCADSILYSTFDTSEDIKAQHNSERHADTIIKEEVDYDTDFGATTTTNDSTTHGLVQEREKEVLSVPGQQRNI